MNKVLFTLLLAACIPCALGAMDNEYMFTLPISDQEVKNHELITAVKACNYKNTLYFLKNGADPNYSYCANGRTALIEVCINDNPVNAIWPLLDVVKLLMIYDADCLVRDARGYCAFDYAVKKDLSDIISWMYSTNSKVKESCLTSNVPPLNLAAFYGALGSIKFLLKQRIPVNTYDSSGRTPLHIAISKGHKKIVDELFDYDADVTQRTMPPLVNNQLTHDLEAGSNSFHLAASLPASFGHRARVIKQLLLLSFHNGTMNVKQVYAFLMCVRRISLPLYDLRKSIIASYIVSFSYRRMTGLLSSPNKQTCTIADQTLRYKTRLLLKALAQTNAHGLTAFEIETKHIQDNTFSDRCFDENFELKYARLAERLKPKTHNPVYNLCIKLLSYWLNI